jgi:RNA polymerase sigma-70 factor, ECF subfamily
MATADDKGRQVELAELVTAAQAGDRQAFDELVRRTHVEMYTLAVRLTGNEEDASDVVQEAYLRAWKGIRRFRGDAQFTTWMYRITANAASTATQRRRRQRVTHIDEVAEPVEMRLEHQPEGAAESAAALEELSVAVSELPPKLRAIVVLKDVYGLSHEDIAEELGISVAAAKVRLHRGRRKLRDLLYDEEGRQARAV